MLKRVIIDNYKSIRHAEIDFGRINILIGENGAGKSNLCSFFELAQVGSRGMNQYIHTHLGMGRILHGGPRKSRTLSGQLLFEGYTDGDNQLMEQGDTAYSFEIGIAIDGTTPVVLEEAQYIRIPEGSGIEAGEKSLLGGVAEDEELRQLNVGMVAESNPGFLSAVGRVRFIKVPINSISIFHFSDTGDGAEIRSKVSLDDNAGLKKNGGNLAAVLYLIKEKDPQAFRLIESMMRRVAPYFKCFDLKPDRLNPNLITIEWKELDSEVYLDSTSFSDGTIRFLALSVLLLQPNPPKTIVIDEPELGLHPAAISMLAGLIRRASHKSQIIVATQSPDLLGEFSLNDVIVVDRRDGQSTFNRFDEETFKEWLSEYSVGELWKKNLIGGQP